MITVAIGGGFDPIHIGHTRLIKGAKELGDRLVVIMFRDDQIIKKKGYCFMPYDERKEILESIEGVDEVVPNVDDDLSSNKSLEHYKPDIWAKGGDRQGRSEAATCEKIGCKRVWAVGGGEKVQSSSKLVEHAQNVEKQISANTSDKPEG